MFTFGAYAGITQRLQQESAEAEMAQPVPLSEYYDAHSHTVELDKFTPAVRCRQELNQEGTVYISNVEASTPLAYGSLALQQVSMQTAVQQGTVVVLWLAAAMWLVVLLLVWGLAHLFTTEYMLRVLCSPTRHPLSVSTVTCLPSCAATMALSHRPATY